MKNWCGGHYWRSKRWLLGDWCKWFWHLECWQRFVTNKHASCRLTCHNGHKSANLSTQPLADQDRGLRYFQNIKTTILCAFFSLTNIFPSWSNSSQGLADEHEQLCSPPPLHFKRINHHVSWFFNPPGELYSLWFWMYTLRHFLVFQITFTKSFTWQLSSGTDFSVLVKRLFSRQCHCLTIFFISD